MKILFKAVVFIVFLAVMVFGLINTSQYKPITAMLSGILWILFLIYAELIDKKEDL